MRGWIRGKRWFWWGLLLLAIAGGGWAWVKRDSLWAKYYAHRLASCRDDERALYVERLAELNEAAIDPLIQRLDASDETARVHCGWALSELANRWGIDHPFTEQLARKLAREYLVFTSAGREQTLLVFEGLYRRNPDREPPPAIAETTAQVLVLCLGTADHDLRHLQLRVARAYVQQAQPGPCDGLEACKTLAIQGLGDGRAECRVEAVRLCAAKGVHQLEPVYRLLASAAGEPSAEVRYHALLAIGPPEFDQLAPTDELFRFLHDPDSDVAFVCTKVLGSRGMTPEQIQLTRKMTHPEPAARAQAPTLAFRFPSDVRGCLARLSQDPDRSVRAAVLRAIEESGDEQFADLVRQLAEQDPSPTIREIARYVQGSIEPR